MKQTAQLNQTAPPQVKARITKAVNQAKKSGDWISLENILPTTAPTNRNRGERITDHRIKIKNPDFKIDGVGNNTTRVVIVIGNRQITRTINPNPQPYQTDLAITTDPQQVNHYTPITGLTALAWKGTTVTQHGTIHHPTPNTNTQTKPTPKPHTDEEPDKFPVRPTRPAQYSPLSRNRRKSGRVHAPAGSLRDLAKLGRRV